MSKAKSQIRHARRRAYERYGVMVDEGFIKKIVKVIQNNQATLVSRQSRRVTIWDVSLNGSQYRVVYDSNTKSLATFLPPNEIGEGDLDML